MKEKEFQKFMTQLKAEGPAYVAAVLSAERARKSLDDTALKTRTGPTLRRMGQHTGEGPWYSAIPDFVSLQRISGFEPKLNSEAMSKAINEAARRNNHDFFVRLGRNLAEIHKPQTDWLSVFLVSSWVEIPCWRNWRNDGAHFPGLMFFDPEDIGYLFDTLMPWAANQAANNRRKTEVASPRTVTARIKKLGLVRCPFIKGRIIHRSGEGQAPLVEFVHVS